MKKKLGLTKIQYLQIRDNVKEDIIPVLHDFFNHVVESSDEQLTIEEFRYVWAMWLNNNPIMFVSQSVIIETVFKKMDEIYEL